MPKIECKNLKKVYDGGVYALNGISFVLESGDFLTVIGESGGGKTTLLKCLSGLLPITAGELFINGELCNLSPVQERKVGVVFQEFTLYPNMTVFENVAFALKKQKLSFEEECQRVREILDKMGLTVIQSALPRQISYGQKQKVALARALVKNPDIVLFDEPMSNIDEPSRVQYREMIKDAKKNYPESIFIYVTHNIEDALTMGNKTMIIHKGRILQFCESRTLYSFPNSPDSAEYIFGELASENVVVKNNTIWNDSGELALDRFTKASIPFSKYANKELKHVFNSKMSTIIYNGRAICGVLDEYSFPCLVENNVLTVGKSCFDISSISEGLLSSGQGEVVLKRNKLSLDYLDDSIKLSATVKYADNRYVVYEVDEVLISDYNTKSLDRGVQVDIYYPITELALFDLSGNIMLASYLLTGNNVKAKVVSVRNGKIEIGGKTFILDEAIPETRYVDVSIDLDAFYLSNKKGGIPITVINEEYSKEFTLCYACLKGQDEYIIAKLPVDTRCFSTKQLYLGIDTTKVRIL